MARGPRLVQATIMGVTHVVSAGHYLATAAGYRILENGGNAIDAGVAAGIAINVTLPHQTSLEVSHQSLSTMPSLTRWLRSAVSDAGLARPR